MADETLRVLDGRLWPGSSGACRDSDSESEERSSQESTTGSVFDCDDLAVVMESEAIEEDKSLLAEAIFFSSARRV